MVKEFKLKAVKQNNQEEITTKEMLEKILEGQNELKTDVSFLKEGQARLENDVSGLKTDVSGLKTDVSGLKTDVSELKIDVAELKTNVASLEKRQINLEQKVESMDNSIKLWEGEFKPNFKAINETLSMHLEHHERKEKEWKQAMDEIHEMYATMNRHIAKEEEKNKQ